MQATLYYVYDPMCSWCWGFKPVWQKLCEQLPDSVGVRYVAGGLAPDSQLPMPEEMQLKLQMIWQQIHRQLGTEFNFAFWSECKPRRSTYPSCRAVIAAGLQGRLEGMITAIQRAYYLRAMNPSDDETLITLARELGLDVARFREDLNGERVEKRFREQRELTAQLPIQGFPSLVLEVEGAVIPLALNYQDADAMADQVRAILHR